MQEVAPGRPNVVGVLDGRGARAVADVLRAHRHGRRVGHDAAVRSGRARRENLRPRLAGHEGRRGGDDRRRARDRRIRRARGGRLVIACVVDEEHASIGADALVTKWRADGGVVTEPTDLRVAVAHKGFEWVEIETEGRAAHGSRPREGRDANRLMGRVLAGLDALDRELQSRTPHPLLGTASLHASLIEGGHELSSYPDRCHLQMERRTIPGEAPGSAGREVRRSARAAAREDADFKR